MLSSSLESDCDSFGMRFVPQYRGGNGMPRVHVGQGMAHLVVLTDSTDAPTERCIGFSATQNDSHVRFTIESMDGQAWESFEAPRHSVLGGVVEALLRVTTQRPTPVARPSFACFRASPLSGQPVQESVQSPEPIAGD
jgi:hypothetical protein